MAASYKWALEAVVSILLEKAEGSRALTSLAQQRTYERHWAPVHFDISVFSLEATLKHAQAAGATLESGPNVPNRVLLLGYQIPLATGFA